MAVEITANSVAFTYEKEGMPGLLEKIVEEIHLNGLVNLGEFAGPFGTLTANQKKKILDLFVRNSLVGMLEVNYRRTVGNPAVDALVAQQKEYIEANGL